MPARSDCAKLDHAVSAQQRGEIGKRILRPAKPLFAQQGFRRVSIDRIAATVGLSK